MINRVFFIFLFLSSTLLASANPLQRAQNQLATKSIQQARKTYLKVLKQYKQKFCKPSVYNKYEKLLSNFQQTGVYIPQTPHGEIDFLAIENGLPILKKKLQWIQKQKTKVSSISIAETTKLVNDIAKNIDEVLNLKKQAFLQDNQIPNKAVAATQVKSSFEKLTTKAPYITNFAYPVDHLKNRLEYIEAKNLGKSEANKKFFLRKIYEDGTYNSKNKGYDKYIRTTLDTIGLHFKTNNTLTENTRYDLEEVLNYLNKELKKGKKHYLGRINNWEKRVTKQITAYNELLSKKGTPQAQEISEKKNLSTQKLKDYVYLRQARAYEYFSKQPTYIRALFAIDQILLNEVGAATAYNYRDRKDVTQVVLNRVTSKNYSQLRKTDSIFKSLKQKTRFKSATSYKYPWLNTLFRQGEFSFNYFYFPASYYSFCPDYYKVARNTRFKNTALGIYQIKKPDPKFLALKYYSRRSMTGRINVEKIWPDAEIIPERPGRRLKQLKTLKKQIKHQKFKYFYSFIDPKKEKYHVIEINNQKYSLKQLSPLTISHYRDPNYFTFFK